MVGLFSQFYKRATPTVNYRKESNFLYTIKLSVLKLCLRQDLFQVFNVTDNFKATKAMHSSMQREFYYDKKNDDKKTCFSMNILSQMVLRLREIQSDEKSGERLHYTRCPFQFR